MPQLRTPSPNPAPTRAGHNFETLHSQLLWDADNNGGLDTEISYYKSSGLLVYSVMPSMMDSSSLRILGESTSFNNLGVEFASKIALLAAQPLDNATASHPDIWFILINGPTVMRTATYTA